MDDEATDTTEDDEPAESQPGEAEAEAAGLTVEELVAVIL